MTNHLKGESYWVHQKEHSSLYLKPVILFFFKAVEGVAQFQPQIKLHAITGHIVRKFDCTDKCRM